MKFFDSLSESLYNQIPKSSASNVRVMMEIGQFSISQSYVTSKVTNRMGNEITINIQAGSPGIELQPDLFINLKELPKNVFLKTVILNSNQVFIRKLPVIGVRDWLLIYENDLFVLAVKDSFDEIEILS